MTSTSRQKIFDKLQLLDQYLSYLQELKRETKTQEQFLKNFRIFGSTERYLQLTYQIIIDILDIIIIEKGIEKPEDRRETISLLYNKGIISSDLAPQLESTVGLRNILVHHYGKIDRKKIYKQLTEKINYIKQFKKEILAYLKKA